MNPLREAFAQALRASLRGKMLAILLVAALVPPALTAAWVYTHQQDVAPSGISLDPPRPQRDDLVNITATIKNAFDRQSAPFNATLRVGYFEEREGQEARFVADKEERFRVPALAAGATHLVRMNWTAKMGTYVFQAIVDTDDELQEIEERNNDFHVQVPVTVPSVPIDIPRPPALPGNASLPAGDIAVESIAWEPEEIYQNQQGSVLVTLRNQGATNATNVSVALGVHAATLFGYSQTPSPDLEERVDVPAGQTATVGFPWRPTRVNQYALFVVADPSATLQDTNSTNDALVQETFIDRQYLYEAPPAKATAKDFYKDVLGLLHLRLLIPLLALAFAAGVLEDERQRGNLPYIWSRPVPRGGFVLARTLAAFLVVAVAMALGVAATSMLLLGVPQGAAGTFYWPMLLTVGALAAYTGLFTLAGVVFARPYLAGLTYVLGLEVLVFLGQGIQVNGRPLLQDWVGALSVSSWMQKALDAWDPNAAFTWWPGGSGAGQAVAVMAATSIGGLAAAAVWAERVDRE